ncbi:MAG: GNAT family N-acetyltransferase [Proteobacteria bacterium]|nr:GNAT family N-acetyltransferase [Pseudomonadota bacterium]NOG61658.1 GNAT family N-acetyltransferase [Pseudomonadota bacterium]
MNIEIILADFSNEQQCADIVSLLNDYALDPMGGGKGLSSFAKENLITELSKLPYAISVICYLDKKPAGLVNCFQGFSTFKCKPLLNIHDVIVLSEYRGFGLCQRLLTKVEEIAKEKGCCKLTLEVLEGNNKAQKAYIEYGFEAYELDPASGKALFWQKSL